MKLQVGDRILLWGCINRVTAIYKRGVELYDAEIDAYQYQSNDNWLETHQSGYWESDHYSNGRTPRSWTHHPTLQ